MHPFLAEASYVNYLGDVAEEAVRSNYGKKYQSLAELKDKYDPTNLFHMTKTSGKPEPHPPALGSRFLRTPKVRTGFRALPFGMIICMTDGITEIKP